MTVILGDIHLRPEEPFYSSVIDTMKYIVDSEYNREDTTWVLLGDLSEKSLVNGNIQRVLISFLLLQLKGQKIILRGNHDVSEEEGCNLNTYKDLPGIQIIEKPCVKYLDGFKCLLAPHIPNSELDMPLHEYYSSLPKELSGNYTFLFSHVTDESIEIVRNKCDFSSLNIKRRIQGHHHVKNDNYLGSISLNSVAESGKTPYIYVFDEGNMGEYVEIPKNLEYYTVDYPNSLPKITTKYAMVKVRESLDRDMTVEKYMKEFEDLGVKGKIYRVERKKFMEAVESDSDGNDGDDEPTIFDFYKYMKQETSMDKKVQEILDEALIPYAKQ